MPSSLRVRHTDSMHSSPVRHRVYEQGLFTWPLHVHCQDLSIPDKSAVVWRRWTKHLVALGLPVFFLRQPVSPCSSRKHTSWIVSIMHLSQTLPEKIPAWMSCNIWDWEADYSSWGKQRTLEINLCDTGVGSSSLQNVLNRLPGAQSWQGYR